MLRLLVKLKLKLNLKLMLNLSPFHYLSGLAFWPADVFVYLISGIFN